MNSLPRRAIEAAVLVDESMVVGTREEELVEAKKDTAVMEWRGFVVVGGAVGHAGGWEGRTALRGGRGRLLRQSR